MLDSFAELALDRIGGRHCIFAELLVEVRNGKFSGERVCTKVCVERKRLHQLRLGNVTDQVIEAILPGKRRPLRRRMMCDPLPPALICRISSWVVEIDLCEVGVEHRKVMIDFGAHQCDGILSARTAICGFDSPVLS